MPLTYKDAGVDIEKANTFIERIRGRASLTLNDHVLAHVGGFAGCFELPEGYRKPVLVSGTDGVGSKLKLAGNNPDYLLGIGQDLAAMVLNDIVCCGAKPLFFLDYFAAGSLNPEKAERVIDGLIDALQECNTALLGGETAELPGLFSSCNEFDVAGFGVGIAEKDKLIDGHENVKAGHIAVGIASTGPHSNGYSLIRSILDVAAHNTPADEFEHIVDQVMAPTALYVNPIHKLLEQIDVRGIANITGGGLIENVPRVVDTWFKVVIDVNSWPVPSLYEWLRTKGTVPADEMYNVFNMGIGMVIFIDPTSLSTTLSILHDEFALDAWKIGDVVDRKDPDEPQILIS